MYVGVCSCLYEFSLCVDMCLCENVCECFYVCLWVCLYVFVFAFMCVCVCIVVCICVSQLMFMCIKACGGDVIVHVFCCECV